MTKADDILAGMEASAWRIGNDGAVYPSKSHADIHVARWAREHVKCADPQPLFDASTVRAALEKMERETLERAARIAENCPITVQLTPGTACGASSASRQIVRAIRTGR